MERPYWNYYPITNYLFFEFFGKMRSQKKSVPEETQRGIVNKLSNGILIRIKQTAPKLALAGKLRNTIFSF